jgi:hypothetical protein
VPQMVADAMASRLQGAGLIISAKAGSPSRIGEGWRDLAPPTSCASGGESLCHDALARPARREWREALHQAERGTASWTPPAGQVDGLRAPGALVRPLCQTSLSLKWAPARLSNWRPSTRHTCRGPAAERSPAPTEAGRSVVA